MTVISGGAAVDDDSDTVTQNVMLMEVAVAL